MPPSRLTLVNAGRSRAPREKPANHGLAIGTLSIGGPDKLSTLAEKPVRPLKLVLAIGVLLALIAACSSGSASTPTAASDAAEPVLSEANTAADNTAAESPQDPRPDDASEPTPTAVATVAPTPTQAAPTPTPRAFAEATELPRAPIGLEGLTDVAGTQVEPVALRIEDLGIDTAAVLPVGVNPDTTLEVPAAEDVGWYRFGVAPGSPGSAVLAAHIAYDGVDGVFRNLADIEIGSVVEVDLADGTSTDWKIVSVTEYGKEELPQDLWATDGDPRLALITCGGAFNPTLRSYDSNTVAVAVPVEAA